MASALTLLIASLPACGDGTQQQDVGLTKLAAWEDTPVLDTSGYRQFSTYDRKRTSYQPIIDPGNKDFNNFLAVCGQRPAVLFQELDNEAHCEGAMEGYVIASTDEGPGYVSRLWLTMANLSTGGGFEDEVLRVYVDDLTAPAYEGKIASLREATDLPFVEPFAGPRSGSVVSYAPISFSSRLRILLDELSPFGTYYYQVDVQQTDAPTAAFDRRNFTTGSSQAARALLAASGTNPNSGFSLVLDRRPVRLMRQGETDVLRYEGRGTVELLTLTFREITLRELQNLGLTVFWDHMQTAAVSAPVSAFYGCQLAISPFRTLPMSVQEDARGLHLSFFMPMPFSTGALIRLRNHNHRDIDALVTVGIDRHLPRGPWGHFHASYHFQEQPIGTGTLYPVISVAGQGKYVGTFMFLEGHADEAGLIPDAFNFLEGDERGVVDGEVRILGTGTEDYFNGAYYFREGEYESPFGGLNVRWRKGDGSSGAVSAYRWHLLTDAINFQSSLSLEFEYGADKPEVADRYASVAYFYLRPGP